MRSLAAIAHGFDDNLLTRAAGVQLKKRRPLVLLAREAPLSAAHLRNMQTATELGAVILPPVPTFYLRPSGLEAVAEQIAARAVDLLRLAPAQATEWAGCPPGHRQSLPFTPPAAAGQIAGVASRHLIPPQLLAQDGPTIGASASPYSPGYLVDGCKLPRLLELLPDPWTVAEATI